MYVQNFNKIEEKKKKKNQGFCKYLCFVKRQTHKQLTPVYPIHSFCGVIKIYQKPKLVSKYGCKLTLSTSTLSIP